MEPTTQKRPIGMTILLVLSFLNACWNILSSLVSYFFIPRLSTMLENGQFEEMIAPFSGMNEEMTKMMTDGATLLSQINPNYYLILMVLFIASLVGVIRMFKGDKRGLHIYAIAQICMLINASVFLYPLQLAFCLRPASDRHLHPALPFVFQKNGDARTNTRP